MLYPRRVRDSDTSSPLAPAIAIADDPYSLAHSTALITGAASGIGLAIARRLRQSSARLVLLDIDDEGLVRLRDGGIVERELSFVADISHRTELERVRDDLESMGIRPDIVVANAGVNVRVGALDLKDADLRRIIDTNLYGTFVTLQVFAPLAMRERGARFIVTGSVAAIHGMALRAAYVSTKAALTGLVRSLAIEWGPAGASVNAVGPGIIATPLLKAYMDEHPERVQAAISNTPLQRLGDPNEIADVVAFLASDAARFITGQTIFVDGGLSAGDSWW
jgi:NAD(P)-dependent dehydrogenase (short-subunit alcohol dehydrogenase family)